MEVNLLQQRKVITDGEKLLINVNCAYEILTHYLRKQCHIESDTVFDICDTNGRLLSINDQQMFSQILYNIEGGGDYILVSITNDQADQPNDIKPLVKNHETAFPNLLGRPNHFLIPNFSELIWNHYHEKSDKKRKYGKRPTVDVKTANVRRTRK
ncbi:hypothetical protein P879_03466 [Paragonimus westermani]|uniref:PB1 domain-containing protein n=1 Tax=Paragonimus westermani TaxID=34504 RepID=A0A8T0DRP7_9TREM|nr:hypothetical protein P879_03466 [Paragonimus westermani]